jgi:hypothetical protein
MGSKSSPKQLTIDGGEVDHEQVLAERAPLSDVQREVLRHIRLVGFITATEAGRIVHAHRADCRCQHPGDQCRSKWIASDGWDVLKRLRARGLVRKYRWFGWGFP